MSPRGGFPDVFDILSTIFPKLPICMGCEDDNGRIRWGQELPAVLEVDGCDEFIFDDDLLGGLLSFIKPYAHSFFNSDFKPLAEENLVHEGYIIINFPGEYADKWVLFIKSYLKDKKLYSIMKIGEHLSRFQELLRESELDPLTGLNNKEAFHTKAYEILTKSSFALMTFIDLDNLKQINDNWGHTVGDRYIISMARHLEKLSVHGAKKACGRISGDEFGLFIGGFGDADTRDRCLDGLISDIRFPLPDGTETQLCFTSGAAKYPEDANNLEDLVVFSDFAMNNMKKTNKGGIGYFCRKSHDIFLDLSARQNKLHEILDKKAITFIYYPYIDASTKQISMYEMFPSSDIAGFDDIEQIKIVSKYCHKQVELDNLICERMTEELKILAEINFPQVLTFGYIPQNLFYHGALNKMLDESRYPANKICFCFNADMRDGYARMKAVDAAKGLGMSFGFKDYTPDSIDDLVLDFRPNIIKILKDIVKDCAQNEDKKNMIRKLIEQSEKLGFKVSAGYIDSLADLKCVSELGVDTIGGDAVYSKITSSEIPRLSRLKKG